MLGVEQWKAILQTLDRCTGKLFKSFASVIDFRLLEDTETSTSRNEVSEDHVLFQTYQFIDFASQCCFSQYFCGFLEGSRTNKAIGLHRRFGDTEQLSTGGRTFRPLALGYCTSESFDLSIGLLKCLFRNDRILGVITIARIRNLDTAAELFVRFAELESIHHQAGQQVGVTGGLDFHFTQHASNDDFAMLIVNLNLLRLVDLLDLMQQVLLHGFLTRDSQDVVWNQRPINQGLTGLDQVTAMHLEVFSVWHKVFPLNSRFTPNDNGSFAAFSFFENFNFAVDFCNHSRIFRLSSLENLGHTW